MAKENLKRELEHEALTRIEDTARTPEDFEKVTKWWDRLDTNRERRERDHEIGRDENEESPGWEVPPTGSVLPRLYINPFRRLAMRGDFLDINFNCPYEMHELVEDADISEMIQKLSENHKEVLFYSAVHLYDCARIAALRVALHVGPDSLHNELGLNRSNVETRLNISNGTIRRWENSDPQLSSITKVAKLVNRSIDYFAGLTDSPNGQYSLKLSPEEFEILSILRDPVFVQEDREKLKTIIQILYQYRLKINTKENEV